MEMVLTPIITGVLVVVILLIAHAIDKNNRSIDRVRKYVKKSMDDIDQYVHTKQEVLKQSSIDFDSNKIAIDRLLEHFETIQNGLNEKLTSVDALFDRVETYKKSVSGIDTQINEVNDKLGMLKVEAAFLDQLSKQIHQSKQKMDQIDSQSAKILKDFEDKNAAQMEALWVSAVEEANRVKATLTDQVDSLRLSVSDFEDHIHSLEAQRDRMESEWMESAEKQLASIADRRLSEFDRVSEGLEGELKGFLSQYQAEVAGYTRETNELKKEYALSLEKNAAILRKHLQASEATLQSLDVKTDGLNERAQEIESLVAHIRSYDPEIEKLSALQGNIQQNLSDLNDGRLFVEGANKRLTQLQDAFDQLHVKLDTLETDLIDKNKQSLHAVADGVKSSVETTAQTFLAQFEGIRTQLTDFEGRMRALDDERSRFFASSEADFASLMEARLKQAKTDGRELFETVQGDLTKISGSLAAELQERLEHMRTETAALEGDTRQLLSQMEQLKTASLAEMEEAHRKGSEALDIESAGFKQEMMQTVDHLKQKLETETERFREFRNQSSLAFKDEQLAAEKVSNRIALLLSELGDKSNQVEQLASKLSNYDEQMDRLAKLTHETAEQLTFIEGRKHLIGKLEMKVRQSEKSLASVEERIPQIQLQLTQDNEARLQSLFERQQANETAALDTFLKRVESAGEQVADFEIKIGFLQNRRDQMGEELLTALRETASESLSSFESALAKQMTEQTGAALSQLQTQAGEIVAAYNREISALENEASSVSRSAALTTGRLSASLKDESDKISAHIQTLTEDYKAEVAKHAEFYRNQRSESEAVKAETRLLLDQLSGKEKMLHSLYERLEAIDAKMKEVSQLSDETYAHFQEVQKQNRMILGLVKAANSGEAKLSQIEKRLPELEAEFSESNRAALEGVFRRFSEQTDAKWSEVREAVEAARSELEAFNAETERFFAQKRAEGDADLVQFKERLKQICLSAESEQQAVARQCEADINGYLSDFKNSTGELFTQTTNLIQVLQTSYGENESQWANRLQQFNRETEAVEARFHANMDNMLSRVQESDDSVFGSLKAEIGKAAEGARSEMLHQLEAAKQEWLSFKTNLEAQREQVRTVSHERLLQMEGQIADFEHSVNQRYDALESLPKQLSQLESSLKGYMKAETQKVRDDFNQFSTELTAMEQQEREKAAAVSARFDETVKEIESGVSALKAEAHEHMTGKLLSVESDFSADLEDRKAALQLQVAAFTEQVNERMNAAQEAIDEDRTALEKRLRAAFVQEANEHKAGCLDELKTVTESIAEFKDSVEKMVSEAKNDFNLTQKTLSMECTALKTESSHRLENELQLYNEQCKGDLALSRQEFLKELDAIRSSIGDNNEQVNLMLSQSRSNIDQWQEAQLSQWAAHQESMNRELGDFKEGLKKEAESFRGAFKGRWEEFENDYTQKVVVVNGKIETLGQSLENFTNLLTTSKVTFGKEVKESKAMLLAHSEEIRKEILEMQGGLENRISGAVHILENESESINRQIQDFKKQTQLFERADSLKLKLTEEMQQIRTTIDQLKEEKKALKATDKDFENIRKLEADLTNRLNMIKNQRAFFETLDEKFTRLLSVSSDVDSRLKTLSNSNEKLQAMELQARRLTSLESDLNEKYAHLDNQQKMLEETNKGVGLAFGELNKIEERMKTVNGDLVHFLKHLKESNDRIQLLSNGKADADRAAKLLIHFDEKLSNLEKHLEEVRQSEEWFAGTETRIKSYSDKMDESLRIFATLNAVKNNGANHPISQSDKKAMILKFAKEGWTIEQIQNATGISRGEIELTLQMISKTK